VTSSGTISQKVAVDLPSDCERLAVEVKVPSTKAANGKPATLRVVLRRYAVALGLANDTIVSLGECVGDQRSAYQNYQPH
jgi:hypothetical protein